MATYTLWAVNRAIGFMPAMRDALGARHTVRICQRVMPGSSARDGAVPIALNMDEDSAPGELMHEGELQRHLGQQTAHDEYFIPIPVKCIGDPHSAFWQEHATDAGRALLQRIVAASPAMGVHDAYWRAPRDRSTHSLLPAKPSPAFGDIHMNTRADTRVGLYQILKESKRLTNADNVLVGYSQGGVVARFLAFLDEHVAKARCIDTVITVQAPNRGSPMAREKNEKPALRALAAALLSVPGFLPRRAAQPLTEHLEQITNNDELDFAKLSELLDAIARTLMNESPRPAVLELVRTARKWTSGLVGVQLLAFWDLDPCRLDEPDTVLHLLHPTAGTSAHTAVRHGGVVGSNPSVIGFVDALVKAGLPWLNLRTFFLRLVYTLARRKIAGALAVADEIYRHDVMDIADAHSDAERALAAQMTNGLAAGAFGLDEPITPRAHDFVIPAAAQIVLPGAAETFLGNLVNIDAGHLAGAVGNDADPSDEALVSALLGRL